MSDVSRAEFESRSTAIKNDINKLGDTLRETIRQNDVDNQKAFASLWKSMNNMLVKVAVVVTACTTVVMAVFKYIEVVGKQ